MNDSETKMSSLPIPEPFIKLAMNCAVRGRLETTVEAVFDSLELPESMYVLDRLDATKNALIKFGLEMRPSFEQGDLQTQRILQPVSGQTADISLLLAEISSGEAAAVEFKSSLHFDHQRAKHQANATAAELKSEEVLYSTLKTIAAFLTCGGGILLIGVENDSSIIGISPDFRFCSRGEGNPDTWQLDLRSQVEGKFKEGKNVNDYIDISFFEIQGKVVARIQVYARRKLAFLTRDKKTTLFRRQGNRTVEVAIDEVEEFLMHRKEKGYTP